MKFKVGDKVRIKRNISDIEVDSSWFVIPIMRKLEGSIVVIREVYDENETSSHYRIIGNECGWREEWLESAYEHNNLPDDLFVFD